MRIGSHGLGRDGLGASQQDMQDTQTPCHNPKLQEGMRASAIHVCVCVCVCHLCTVHCVNLNVWRVRDNILGTSSARLEKLGLHEHTHTYTQILMQATKPSSTYVCNAYLALVRLSVLSVSYHLLACDLCDHHSL